MKKRRSVLIILCLCLAASLFGCRSRVKETESETQSETVKMTESETKTEKMTEPETKKTTTKTTEVPKKTTVKPSTVKPNSPSGTTNRTPGSNSLNNNTNNNSTNNSGYGTQQCPYCYQQISTAPNGDGTTVYSVHVAQEKNWADTYGYGDTPPQTEAPQQSTDSSSNNGDDSAQCPYCYQWFSVSDGTYNAHIAAENSYITNNPPTTEYIQCPKCGNVYPAGIAYDTHLCPTN